MSTRFSETAKWEDLWFRDLPGVHKLVFLYLVDKCNNAGFWEIDIAGMVFQTKLEQRHIEGAMKGLARGFIEKDGWIWIRNFLKHQRNLPLRPENPAHRHIIHLIKEKGESFPEAVLLLPDSSEKRGFEGPLKAPCTGTSHVKVTSVSAKREKFIVPTVEEVVEYGAEIGLPKTESEQFRDHHEARGWELTTGKMKDWKAALRTWRRNWKKFQAKDGTITPPPAPKDPPKPLGTAFQGYLADCNNETILAKAPEWKTEADLPISIRDAFATWKSQQRLKS